VRIKHVPSLRNGLRHPAFFTLEREIEQLVRCALASWPTAAPVRSDPAPIRRPQ
jgi:hypothetical protein